MENDCDQWLSNVFPLIFRDFNVTNDFPMVFHWFSGISMDYQWKPCNNSTGNRWKSLETTKEASHRRLEEAKKQALGDREQKGWALTIQIRRLAVEIPVGMWILFPISSYMWIYVDSCLGHKQRTLGLMIVGIRTWDLTSTNGQLPKWFLWWGSCAFVCCILNLASNKLKVLTCQVLV